MAGRSRAALRAEDARGPGYAGEAYLALILELLAEETRTRELLERRAVGVLAATAIIVTLLATLIDGEQLIRIRFGPWASLFGVLAGIVGFGAGLFAWLTILPRRYEVAAIEALKQIVATQEYWVADVRIGTLRAAEVHVTSLDSARTANGHKAWSLSVAMGLGLIAVTLLAASAVAFVMGA